jgi:hypothetical protein
MTDRKAPSAVGAAIIAEAWSFVHGVEPAPTNQKAAAAAHLFWRESLEGLSMEETKLALDWKAGASRSTVGGVISKRRKSLTCQRCARKSAATSRKASVKPRCLRTPK